MRQHAESIGDAAWLQDDERLDHQRQVSVATCPQACKVGGTFRDATHVLAIMLS
jgi:hypothetical protein